MDTESARNVIGNSLKQAIIGGTASRITGNKFSNGAFTAALQYIVNEAGSRVQQQEGSEGSGFLSGVFKKLTNWHFEGRDIRNSDLPSYEQAIGENSQWKLLSLEQSVFHDNGIGHPELKFIHPDGREVVFDGDSFNLVTNPQYMGTYNYVNPLLFLVFGMTRLDGWYLRGEAWGILL